LDLNSKGSVYCERRGKLLRALRMGFYGIIFMIGIWTLLCLISSALSEAYANFKENSNTDILKILLA
jgi:hypothetical protein